MTCTTVVQSFMLVVTMPLGGITSGTQTILGYNYGAKRPDRIWRAEKWIGGMALCFTTIMFLIAQLVPEIFVRLFTQNEEYIRLSVWAIPGVYPWGDSPGSPVYHCRRIYGYGNFQCGYGAFHVEKNGISCGRISDSSFCWNYQCFLYRTSL